MDWPEEYRTLELSTPIKVLAFAFKPLNVNRNVLDGVGKQSEHFMHSGEFLVLCHHKCMDNILSFNPFLVIVSVCLIMLTKRLTVMEIFTVVRGVM